eukprot:g68063.t1
MQRFFKKRFFGSQYHLNNISAQLHVVILRKCAHDGRKARFDLPAHCGAIWWRTGPTSKQQRKAGYFRAINCESCGYSQPETWDGSPPVPSNHADHFYD